VADSGECKKSGSDEVQLAMSAVSGISCLLSGPGQKNGTQMIHPIDITKRFGEEYLCAISLIIDIYTPALLASGRLNFLYKCRSERLGTVSNCAHAPRAPSETR
jgi:hypothetical protein